VKKSTIDILFDNEMGTLYYGEPTDMVRWLKERTTHGRTVSVASSGVTMDAADYLAMRKLEAVTELLVAFTKQIRNDMFYSLPVKTDEDYLEMCEQAAEKFVEELS
jgi:hypothetical protein